MTLRIRRATVDDVEALAPLFDGYRQFYRQPSDLSRARAFLLDRLSRSESVVYLAEIEGRASPVGFTQLYPSFTSVSTGRAWILNDLYVSPDARRYGVGRALLDRARDHAVETGAIYLELATEVSNATAQRLYESLGWVREVGFHHYTLRVHS
jgi:ribosomal protein S18 acetylase RimI-like enzyme